MCTVRGSLPLDALTIDKIIREHEWVLIKFDTAYPFGDLHDEWKGVARDFLSACRFSQEKHSQTLPESLIVKMI